MPQMSRLAGMIADGIHLHPINTIRRLKEVTLPAIEAGARAAGRTLADIELAPSLICSISNDRSEALHWAKARIASYLPHPYMHPVFDIHGFGAQRAQASERLAQGDPEGAIDAIPDELAEAIVLAGTPDDCRRRLAEYAEIGGVPRLLQVSGQAPPDYVAHSYDQMIRTFGRE